MFELVYKAWRILLPTGWRYDYNWILAYRCLQAMSLTKDVKFGPDWILHVDVSVKISHFLLPAGGAMTILIWSHRSLQVRSLIKHVKFGADRTLHAWVNNNFLFHGETSKLVRRPRTRPSTKTLNLRNLTSQRALD